MPLKDIGLLLHRIGPSMSNALRCTWLASSQARHTHSQCVLNRLAPPQRRQRLVWQHHRHCTVTACADNGNSASANEQTFFATTPLYYVSSA